MNNLNKTGKIKIIVLIILFFPNLLMPMNPRFYGGIYMIILPIVYGVIIFPFTLKINALFFGKKFIKPHWNDNPFTFSKPLSQYHFAAFFFISIGLGMLLGTAIKYHTFNSFGLFSIVFGLSLLIGIRITLKLTKPEEPTENKKAKS